VLLFAFERSKESNTPKDRLSVKQTYRFKQKQKQTNNSTKANQRCLLLHALLVDLRRLISFRAPRKKALHRRINQRNAEKKTLFERSQY